VRPRGLPDALDLLHHLDVDDLPARGVCDDEVVAAVRGGLDSPLGDLLGRRFGTLLVDRHTELAPDLLQLVYGRRTVGVAGHQVRVLAELAHEEGELARRRGLAVAVEPGEHHDGRRP
jgi:hypothetical protein